MADESDGHEETELPRRTRRRRFPEVPPAGDSERLPDPPSWDEPDAGSWDEASSDVPSPPAEEGPSRRRSSGSGAGDQPKPRGGRRVPTRGSSKQGRTKDARAASRDRARSRARSGRGGPPRTNGGSPPQRAARRPTSPRLIWIRRVVAIVAVLITAAACWFAIELFQPFHGAAHGSIKVTVPKGATVHDVGTILARDGVISSSFFFKLRADLDGDNKVLAGKYQMQLGMSYAAALKVLTAPPLATPTANIKIIPGRSRKQIAKVLKSDGVTGNYVKLTKHSKLLDPTKYGAPKKTPTLEGFLFPDTYQLRKPVKMSVLIADQLKEFQQKFKQVNLAYARSKNLTAYDVLIIASLIEGEAQTAHDARLTASVIYNRLRQGMDLGLDSTVSYATGNYGALTQKDLNSPSPWNTRNHAGLPPTPINNPGLQTIKDAAHPVKSDYLYFVNQVCGNGKLLFTASYSQFLTWSKEWNDAVVKAQKNHTSAQYCKKQS